MPKKILICEDDKGVADAMKRNLFDRGHEVNILYNKNPIEIIKSLEQELKDKNPDYTIIDGLHGLWQDTAKIAKSYSTPIIFSGDFDILEYASKEYTSFNKPKDIKKMIEFIERD